MCFTLLFTGLWDYSSRVGDGVKRRRNARMTRHVALPKTCEEIQGGFFQHLDPPLNQDFHKVVTPLHIGLPRFPLLKNKLYCRGQLISHYLFLRTYIETCAISPLVPAIWWPSKYWRLIKGIRSAIFLLSSNLLSCPTHISYRSMRYGSHSSLTYNLKR